VSVVFPMTKVFPPLHVEMNKQLMLFPQCKIWLVGWLVGNLMSTKAQPLRSERFDPVAIKVTRTEFSTLTVNISERTPSRNFHTVKMRDLQYPICEIDVALGIILNPNRAIIQPKIDDITVTPLAWCQALQRSLLLSTQQ
jgi:hypothetical protein